MSAHTPVCAHINFLTAPASGICLVSATHRKLSVFNFIYKKGTIDCVSLFSSSQDIIIMYVLRSAKEDGSRAVTAAYISNLQGTSLLFHKLSESLKTACNHVHYRITEIQAKFLNCQSFISSSINYHSSAKFSVTTLVIVLEKLLNLSLLTLSLLP